MIAGQAQQGQRHDGDFEELDADGDGSFAEPIRQVTAGHREKNKRQREEGADDADELVAFVVGESHARD